MKRLIVCCDGTWNKATAGYPTNVLKCAQAIRHTDENGIKQVTAYIEGVGTGRGTGKIARFWDRLVGGMLGVGLMRNVEEAYRFLMFNYEPGDEIFIIGFSRGAFTARTLAGLVRSIGVVERDRIRHLGEAFRSYQERGEQGKPDEPKNLKLRSELSPHVSTSKRDLAWRTENAPSEDVKNIQLLSLSYLGVWDTVGALGVPGFFMTAGLFNKKHRFHDTDLSSMVASARHAVALDERRQTFPAALWDNLDTLNSGNPGTDGEPNYLQVWFPGGHGSVGGGGDITSLSDDALVWIMEGAQRQGLSLHPGVIERFKKTSDFCGPLLNSSKPDKSLAGRAMAFRQSDRNGPDYLSDVSRSAQLRWKADPSKFPDGKPYRPASLARVASELGR